MILRCGTDRRLREIEKPEFKPHSATSGSEILSKLLKLSKRQFSYFNEDYNYNYYTEHSTYLGGKIHGKSLRTAPDTWHLLPIGQRELSVQNGTSSSGNERPSHSGNQ